jgi:hypothetical protein
MKRIARLPLVVGCIYLVLVAVLAIGFRDQAQILFWLSLPSSFLALTVMTPSWPTLAQWLLLAVMGFIQWVWVARAIDKFFRS